MYRLSDKAFADVSSSFPDDVLLLQVRFCRDRLSATGDLGYRGRGQGRGSLGYRYNV
jgi:hypothetical protein